MMMTKIEQVQYSFPTLNILWRSEVYWYSLLLENTTTYYIGLNHWCVHLCWVAGNTV